ncbi:MAG: dihydroorotase [Bacteroidota bacterium]
MNVLLKSAVIVDKGNPDLHLQRKDIYIKEGTIEAIENTVKVPKATTIIERPNLHISVGWFDTGVAFGEPGYEERETLLHGLKVAGLSGFTGLVLHPNTHPTPDSSSDIVFLKDRSEKAGVDVFPLGNLTKGGKGEKLAELFDMHKAGAVGFYDFQSPVSNANLLKIALLYTQGFDGLIFSFPLDITIQGMGVAHEGEISTRLGLKGIPALSEELQIARDLYILEYTGGKLHIPTISTAGAVKLIADAKKKGLNVSCSAAVHHLFLSDHFLEGYDTNYKLLPPLRTKNDQRTLQKAVLNGTIDFVTTDHTPIDIEEKRLEFDNANYGTLGLESAFGALNLLLGMEQSIAILTEGRERFGVPVPTIEQGKPANLTLFNPDNTFVFEKDHIRSTSKNSAFLGQTLKGHPYGTINNNQLNVSP